LSQGSNIRVGRRGGWKDWRPPANRARSNPFSNLPSRTSTSTTGLHTLQDDKAEYCVIITIFTSFVYFFDGNSCLHTLGKSRSRVVLKMAYRVYSTPFAACDKILTTLNSIHIIQNTQQCFIFSHPSRSFHAPASEYPSMQQNSVSVITKRPKRPPRQLSQAQLPRRRQQIPPTKINTKSRLHGTLVHSTIQLNSSKLIKPMRKPVSSLRNLDLHRLGRLVKVAASKVGSRDSCNRLREHARADV
jgi:hypothetical protein